MLSAVRMCGTGLIQSSWAGSVLLAPSVGAGVLGELGSRSFYFVLTVSVTLCAMAQLSPKAPSPQVLCLEQG